MTTDGRLPHVLVIDDFQEILDLLRELLEEEGYRVTTSRALPAMDSVKTLAPDIILQDLRIAGTQEGRTFLTLSRLDPELTRIAMILSTTATRTVNDRVIAEYLDRQDIRVVRKPFNIDELLTALAEVVATLALITHVTETPTDNGHIPSWMLGEMSVVSPSGHNAPGW
jgi:CheY-like chemotaxis protein